MPFYKYNSQAQSKYSNEPKGQYLVGVPREEMFLMASDRSAEYHIRILPPWSAEGAFALRTEKHYRCGQPEVTFFCPDIKYPGKCKFDATFLRFKNDYKKYAADLTTIKAKGRYLSNVINLDNQSVGPLVFEYGIKIYASIKAAQDSGEYGDIFDAREGHNITIKRTVMGDGVSDAVMVSPKSTPVDNLEKVEQLVVNLDTVIPDPDLEMAEQAFRSHPWKVLNVAMVMQQGNGHLNDDDVPNFKSGMKDDPRPASKPPEQHTSKTEPSKMEVLNDLERRLKAKQQAAKDG